MLLIVLGIKIGGVSISEHRFLVVVYRVAFVFGVLGAEFVVDRDASESASERSGQVV
jgi:hypothetical protein